MDMNQTLRLKKTGFFRRILPVLLAVLIAFSAFDFSIAAVSQQSKPVVIAPTQKDVFSKKTYEAFKETIRAICKKKGFSKTVEKFLLEILYYKYQNYSDWQSVYLDLPDAKQYLKENLIHPLKRVKSIQAFNINTKKGRAAYDDAGASGTTDNQNRIRLFYSDPKTESFYNHIGDLEALDHELKHCKDHEFIWNSKDSFYDFDYATHDILTEGAATFQEKFVFPLTASQTAYESIESRSGKYEVAYGKNSGVGYMFNLYVYENLVYLAGYRTMENIGLGNPASTIRKAMIQKYGKKLAMQVWKALIDLYYMRENYSENKKVVFQKAIDTQKLLFQCIRKDIARLDITKPKQIRKYMEVYRNYKLNVMPGILKSDLKDVTAQFLDTSEMDRMLIQKIVKSNAVPRLMQNSKLNEAALSAILYATNRELPYKTDDSGFYYLPFNISATRYQASAWGKVGSVTMLYLNKQPDDYGTRNEKILVTFTLGEDGIQKVIAQHAY